jgi:hypothetical protein
LLSPRTKLKQFTSLEALAAARGAGTVKSGAAESQVVGTETEKTPFLQRAFHWHRSCSEAVGENQLTTNPPIDREMAREILSYFVRNPQATDSLEGVARWRLMDEVIRRKLDETATALEWLVAKGYLTSAISPGGTATFRLNAERVQECRRFLAAAPKCQKDS